MKPVERVGLGSVTQLPTLFVFIYLLLMSSANDILCQDKAMIILGFSAQNSVIVWK